MKLKKGDFVTDGHVRGWYIGNQDSVVLIEREDGKGHDGQLSGWIMPLATYIRKGNPQNNKECFWWLGDEAVKRIPQPATRYMTYPNVSYQPGSKRAKNAVRVGDVWITSKEDPESC